MRIAAGPAARPLPMEGAYPRARAANPARLAGRARGYRVGVADRLEESLKRAVAALDGDGVPHLLGGWMGCWARGGPPSSKDIDLMVRPRDVERALDALERAGMRIERPPEKWLNKAWDGDVHKDDQQ